MKAYVYKKYGGPEVLQLKEVEKPTPSENELLIKVQATTVNRTDCANLRGKPFVMHFVIGFLKPKKQIGGTEFSGIIEAVGVGVQNFKVGDKVFGFDDQVLSAYAEYMTINQDQAIAKIPSNISFEEAAASLEGAHYAFSTVSQVKLERGQKVLVNGGSGGIGSAAIQLLKQYGCIITSTTETKNIEIVKRLGVDRVIDYTTTDFTKEAVKYDFVFDTVGKSSFNKCKPVLASKGIYISSELGWMGANILYSLTTRFSDGQKVMFPLPHPIKKSLIYISELLETGQYKPIIDRVYSFEEIPAAFAYVEREVKVGNVVVGIG